MCFVVLVATKSCYEIKKFMKTSSNKKVFKTWLITGGCGFIGTNLIARLKKENPGCKIRVLDNLLVGRKKDLSEVCNFVELDLPDISDRTVNPEVELVVGDIKDYETCLSCTKGVDVIVHLAASTGVPVSVENPRIDMEANVVGTFNMLEAARTQAVKKFIFASSGAPVGEVNPPIHEELAPHPVSPYGASKLAGEGYCSAYKYIWNRDSGTSIWQCLRTKSNHKSSVVAKFIRNAIDGQTSEIYGDGNQTRDFIFIDDLVNAVIKATVENVGGETFQIATNKEHNVNEVAQMLKESLLKIGIRMNIKHGQHRLGDVKSNFSDTSKAEKILGWQAKVNLAQGIEQTIAWFLTHNS